MIDKVVILSKKVNAVSEGAENLYYRINISADDYGRYYAEPEILKGQVYTLRKIGLKEIDRRINELWQINLIKIYIINGERYLEIIDFEKHQTFKTDRPKKAEFPEPKEYLKYESATRREPLGTQSVPNGSLSKDNLTQVNLTKEKAEIPAISLFELNFEDFWKAYPKKVAKEVALEIFKRLIIKEKEKSEEIILAAERYSKKIIEDHIDKKYTLYPSTFLNKNRWKDYLPGSEAEKNPTIDDPNFWKPRMA